MVDLFLLFESHLDESGTPRVPCGGVFPPVYLNVGLLTLPPPPRSIFRVPLSPSFPVYRHPLLPELTPSILVSLFRTASENRIPSSTGIQFLFSFPLFYHRDNTMLFRGIFSTVLPFNTRHPLLLQNRLYIAGHRGVLCTWQLWVLSPVPPPP